MGNKQRKQLNIAAVLLLLLALSLLCACNGTPGPEKTPPLSEAALPTQTPSPTPAPTPSPTPEPRAERVEDAYFADAAFFGNSLMDGLHSFGGLECGDFFAGTSASVISVESTKDTRLSDGSAATLLEALMEKQYARIYVLLGINELGFNQDGFVDLYRALLEKIQAGQPQAQIFVFSLTPITEKRSENDQLFTRERVLGFNTAIKAMAEQENYIFLDLFNALSDDAGYLPEDHSTDGVHFTAETYLDWAEYLRRNYDGAVETVTFYKGTDVEPTPQVTFTPVPSASPTPDPDPDPNPGEEVTFVPASPTDLG